MRAVLLGPDPGAVLQYIVNMYICTHVYMNRGCGTCTAPDVDAVVSTVVP